MHFNNTKFISKYSKTFFAFSIGLIASIYLTMPIGAMAYEATLPANDGTTSYTASTALFGGDTSGTTATTQTSTSVPLNTSTIVGDHTWDCIDNGDGQGVVCTEKSTTDTSVANPAAAGTSAYTTSSSNSSSGVGDTAMKSISSIGTCSVGSILGRFLSNAISSIITELTNSIKSIFTDNIIGYESDKYMGPFNILAVPSTNPTLERQAYNNTQNTAKLVKKTVGGPAGQSVAGGILGVTDVSMDSIMFCIVNEILTYITNATISWINSGFNGNPVFVQNPGAILESVANTEANSFISAMSKGVGQTTTSGNTLAVVNNSTGAITVFNNSALQSQLTSNLIGAYTSQSSGNYTSGLASPTITTDQIIGLANGVDYGRDVGAQQYNPLNTVYGQTLAANAAMQRQIAAAQQNAQLNMLMNQGIQSPTTCASGGTRAVNGTCQNTFIQNTASGQLIGSTLKNRDMMTYERIALAKDFDSVITALVNQLVKIAVTDISKETGINIPITSTTNLGASAQTTVIYTNNGTTQ